MKSPLFEDFRPMARNITEKEMNGSMTSSHDLRPTHRRLVSLRL